METIIDDWRVWTAGLLVLLWLSIPTMYRLDTFFTITDTIESKYGFDFTWVINDTVRAGDDNRELSGGYVDTNAFTYKSGVDVSLGYAPKQTVTIRYGAVYELSTDGVIYLTKKWTPALLYHEACHGLIYNWNCTVFIGGDQTIHESTCTLFELWAVPDEASRINGTFTVYSANGTWPPLGDNKPYYHLYHASYFDRNAMDNYFNNFEKNCKAGILFEGEQ